MRGTCKKLVKDIKRKHELDKSITEYIACLNESYNSYAVVKMSMNFYTMQEMVNEYDDATAEYTGYFEKITALVKKNIVDGEAVTEEAIEEIAGLRSVVENKMMLLTAFTDGFEIYEYLLNRVEARVKDSIEQVNIDLLADKLFAYVFSEDDTVLVNSKLQLIMSQLPVRMTKMKFFDVVARTIAIYTGSEKTSVDEFADMIRTAVLIKKPEGFETEYPYLLKVYNRLQEMDYKNITLEEYEELSGELEKVTTIINDESSIYLLLQEIINDVYAILLTGAEARERNMTMTAYKNCLDILELCITADNFEDIIDSYMPKFVSIEGVQEDIYEDIIILDAVFDEVRTENADKIEELGLSSDFASAAVADKLLSTSLFIDITKETEAQPELADSAYIKDIKEAVIAELAELFDCKSRYVVRSIMCKVLSSIPIFMNTQQEIKDYFEYVLNNCKDDSELTACSKLLEDIMTDNEA